MRAALTAMTGLGSPRSQIETVRVIGPQSTRIRSGVRTFIGASGIVEDRGKPFL